MQTDQNTAGPLIINKGLSLYIRLLHQLLPFKEFAIFNSDLNTLAEEPSPSRNIIKDETMENYPPIQVLINSVREPFLLELMII